MGAWYHPSQGYIYVISYYDTSSKHVVFANNSWQTGVQPYENDYFVCKAVFDDGWKIDITAKIKGTFYYYYQQNLISIHLNVNERYYQYISDNSMYFIPD